MVARSGKLHARVIGGSLCHDLREHLLKIIPAKLSPDGFAAVVGSRQSEKAPDNPAIELLMNSGCRRVIGISKFSAIFPG